MRYSYDDPGGRYDARLGRHDGSYNPGNPQSFNRYAYVLNNPLSYIDPSGLLDCKYPPCDPIVHPGAGGGTTVYGNPPPQPDPTSGSGGGENGPGGGGGTGGGSGAEGSTAPTKPVVLENPCPYQGRALPPNAYAQAGQAANCNSVTFTLDVFMGFPGGDFLDPQPLGSGNVFQNQAYGNYTFGVYMQSAGLTLPQALSGANLYALKHKIFNPLQYANQTMDPNYPFFPAASAANITIGFTAQQNGSTCH